MIPPVSRPGGAKRRILPLTVALLLGVAAGRVSGAVQAAEQPYAALDVFARVLTQITDAYVEPISQRDLVYHALDGMDNALDAHSRFLDPEALRRLREESDGQFVGIGAQMRQEACGLGVTAVLANGPAERAGIAAGDCIVRVDGAPLADLPLDAALATVRGQEGAAVTLDVSRNGVTHPIAVLRSRLVEASVTSASFAPGWAYLRIRQFRQGTAADLAAQVSALGASTPIRGAVLDLRDNPGGRLDEAIATVDLFLRDGRIVSTRGRSAEPDEIHDATESRGDWDWPVVVLIDGQSASAAEIVAGALQDRARARLVGEPSYGKGSVQSVFEYEDGSALKLTIARYHLPSGRPIEDHRGLVPDVRAPAPSAPGAAQLLREQLSTASGLAAAERDELLALADRIPAEPQRQPIDFTGTLEARLSRDPALALGWKLLHE
ncbi:MAG: S41 family peptidase [Pseudomonadota bacterium]|nr:S41 family peptidase [Pseudomonadota bacterium]